VARKQRSETRQARQFAWILPVILLALAGLSWWRGHLGRAELLAGLALLPPLLAYGLPAVWMRAFRAWMRLAEGLSWVMTRVILTVFFYGVLTPVGLVMRLFGRAPLDLAWRDGRASYWIDKPPRESSLDLSRKQF